MKLLIRADSNAQIGSGHAMRCVALGQACQDAGGRAVFAIAMTSASVEARLQAEGMSVEHLSAQPGSPHDAEQVIDLAQRLGMGWVAVDGYHFGTAYHRMITDAGLRLLVVDDHVHLDHYGADFVLNQNVHAHEGLYANRAPHTRLLLGTQYTLLRREFFKWRGWERKIPSAAQKILVTLGGGDHHNVTLKVVQALRQVTVKGLEGIIVIGGNNQYHQGLESALADFPFPVHLKKNPADMASLMAWADIGITAGGGTSWELAFMGLPDLVIVMADNQLASAEQLGAMGAVVNLGWYETLSSTSIARAVNELLVAEPWRVRMSHLSKKLVDGGGAARVVMHLEEKSVQSVTMSARR